MPGVLGWNNGLSKIFEKKLWDNKHLIISLARVRQEQCVAEVKEAKLKSDGFMTK